MAEQVGWRGFIERVKQETPYWGTILPQLPRLLHLALSRQPSPQPDPEAVELLHERQAQTRLLALIAALLAVIAALFIGLR
jgi:ubiquinone biosynthesis protein